MSEATNIQGGVHQTQKHDSAHKHVSGQAEYIDDINEPGGLLHAYLGLSEIANGKVISMDFSAVEADEDVIGVLTASDIKGENDISPTGKKDDPVFAENIDFHGQPIFAVVAKTRDAARRAAKLAKIEYEATSHITDVADAIAQDYPLVTEPLTLQRGDAPKALEAAENRINGQMRIGGQDHFYLEGHIAMTI